MQPTDRHAEAMRLAELGYRVFRTCAGSKEPLAGSHGAKEATTDSTLIEYWWQARPDANIAVATDGLLLLDIDLLDGGEVNPWLTPEREATLSESGCPISDSPGGGVHYWFRAQEGSDLRCSTSKIATKVDTRANGGYVVVAPSRIDERAGRSHRWRPGHELDCSPERLPLPPAWLLDAIAKASAPKAPRAAMEEPIPEGRRNATLASIGGALRRQGLSPGAIEAALAAINSERCEPPLDAAEVAKIARSMARYEPDAGAAAVAEGWGPDWSDSSEWHPYPTELLPEPIRAMVAETAEAIDCDPAFAALPAIAAAASAIGTTTTLSLKRGWHAPSILWFASVAGSGGGKSTTRDAMFAPIFNRQRMAMRDHEREQREYAKSLAERDLNAAGRGNLADVDEPVLEECWTSDATTEAVADLLARNRRGVFLCPDELTTWLSAMDAYRSGRGADAQRWIECFHGRPLKVNRKGGSGHPKVIFVDRAAVSIFGTVQPAILARVMRGANTESGLAARILFAMPPSRPKRWTEAEATAASTASYAAMFDRLFLLRGAVDDAGDPMPRSIAVSDGAMVLMRKWTNETGDLAHGCNQRGDGAMAAVWSKLEEAAARIALVLHLVDCAARGVEERDLPPLTEWWMAAGIALARWHAREAKRVYAMFCGGDAQDSGESRPEVDLAAWVAKHGSATARDLAKSGPRRFRGDSAAAEAALEALVTEGKLRRETTPAGASHRPTDRYLPAAVETRGAERGDSVGTASGFGSVSGVSGVSTTWSEPATPCEPARAAV